MNLVRKSLTITFIEVDNSVRAKSNFIIWIGFKDVVFRIQWLSFIAVYKFQFLYSENHLISCTQIMLQGRTLRYV